jgi:hypothetical protein
MSNNKFAFAAAVDNMTDAIEKTKAVFMFMISPLCDIMIKKGYKICKKINPF